MGKSKLKNAAPKTKQCKSCKSTIDKKARVCPYCQRAQGSSKGCLISFLVVLGILIGIVVLVATIALNTTAPMDQEKTTTSQSAETWKEFDNKSWKQFVALYKYHNNLITVMEMYSNGQISGSDFYSQCKITRDKFREISLNLNYANTSEEKAYLSVLENWALSGQMAAEDLMDYIDTFKASKLSSANTNLQNAKTAMATAASNRGKLLQKTGLSQSEIEAKIEADMAALE